MIESAWSTSLPGRLLARMKVFYRHSVAGRLMAFLAAQYRLSVLCRWFEGALGTPFRGLHSLFYRLCQGVNRFFHWLGTPFRKAGPTSLYSKLGRWRPIQNSRILGLFRRLTFRRFLIFCFAMYLPIDFLLRTLPVPTFLATGWDEAFLIVCVLYVIGQRMASRRPTEPMLNPVDGVMLFFVAVSFMLMSIISPLKGVAWDGFRAVVQYMLFFFALTRLMRDKSDMMVFYIGLTAVGTVLALHGIYQYVVAAPMPAAWVSVKEMGVRTRAYSIVNSPNILGCFMVMTAPLAAGLAYWAKKWSHKLLAWLAVACMCVCCLVTFSRGAWIGLVVAVVIFSIYQDRRLLGIAGLAVAVGVFIPEIANRVTFLFTSDFAANNETGGRSARWEAGMRLLNTTNPVFGVGLGRFGGAVAMQNQVMERVKYFYLDNYYLKTLVEMGYVGLISYLGLLAGTIWNGMRACFRARANKQAAALSHGLLAGMLGVLTHCLFENIFEVPYMNAYFWGMAAALVIIGFKLVPQTAEKEPPTCDMPPLEVNE